MAVWTVEFHNFISEIDKNVLSDSKEKQFVIDCLVVYQELISFLNLYKFAVVSFVVFVWVQLKCQTSEFIFYFFYV